MRVSMNQEYGRQSGHLLITLMVALMVLAILLGVAFQQWSIINRRDLEQELIFRGGQYVDAIIKYRTEHAGALPTDLEQLYQLGPRGLRYIRKLYKDPFDYDGEGWGLLYLGPGGKWIFDPQAAKRFAEDAAGLDGSTLPASPFGGSGLTSIGPGMQGQAASASNAFGVLPPTGGGRRNAGLNTGTIDLNAVQPIVGVVSRAGNKAFYRFRQQDYYWDWQFHIFAVIREPLRGQRPPSPIPSPGGLGPGGKLYPPGQGPGANPDPFKRP